MRFLLIFLAVFFIACSNKTPSKAPSADVNQSVALSTQVNSQASLDDDFSDLEGEYSNEVIFDPLIGYNRVMTGFNDIIYRYAFTPVFVVYDTFMPAPIQKGISNFFNNLFAPIRFINHLLQFEFRNAAEELFNFAVNSTIGLGGLFEVADTHFGIKSTPADFGQTLGRWGVGAGIPVVLPVLGQSNLRDIVGLAGDYFANPITYSDYWFRDKKIFRTGTLGYSLTGGHMINQGSLNPRAYEVLTRDAFDLYPFLRDAYEQRRNSFIKGE